MDFSELDTILKEIKNMDLGEIKKLNEKISNLDTFLKEEKKTFEEHKKETNRFFLEFSEKINKKLLSFILDNEKKYKGLLKNMEDFLNGINQELKKNKQEMHKNFSKFNGEIKEYKKEMKIVIDQFKIDNNNWKEKVLERTKKIIKNQINNINKSNKQFNDKISTNNENFEKAISRDIQDQYNIIKKLQSTNKKIIIIIYILGGIVIGLLFSVFFLFIK